MFKLIITPADPPALLLYEDGRQVGRLDNLSDPEALVAKLTTTGFIIYDTRVDAAEPRVLETLENAAGRQPEYAPGIPII